MTELPENLELLDQIGPWSEIKLEIIRKYARAYSAILSNQKSPALFHVYVDAFAGAGRHVAKRSGLLVPGSPEIALHTEPPFRAYHFIDVDSLKIARLEQLAANRVDVTVHHGDCNRVLADAVLPHIRFKDYRRGLCILDPYGLHLEWETVRRIGEMGSIEVFLNFPTHDINRNALRRDPRTIDSDQASRMTAFWGDESWRDTFYRPKPQMNLWGEQEEGKNADNERVVEAYRTRLKEIAGFKFVPNPLPMRNSTNAIVYYLLFASHNPVADNIVKDIFARYR